MQYNHYKQQIFLLKRKMGNIKNMRSSEEQTACCGWFISLPLHFVALLWKKHTAMKGDKAHSHEGRHLPS